MAVAAEAFFAVLFFALRDDSSCILSAAPELGGGHLYVGQFLRCSGVQNGYRLTCIGGAVLHRHPRAGLLVKLKNRSNFRVRLGDWRRRATYVLYMLLCCVGIPLDLPPNLANCVTLCCEPTG